MLRREPLLNRRRPKCPTPHAHNHKRAAAGISDLDLSVLGRDIVWRGCDGGAAETARRKMIIRDATQNDLPGLKALVLTLCVHLDTLRPC